MWEVSAETEAPVAPERVWELWQDPARWPDWNEQIAEASLDGDFAEGSTATIRFRRSPLKMSFAITALRPCELFIDETKLPGARMGHEHRLESGGETTRIRHRLYIHGPLERLYAALLGRQMRSSIGSFGEREIELASSSGSR